MVSRLPAAVYILQSGLVLNAFGNGVANPFVLLYLHDVRGIPLGVAGLATAANAGAALPASLFGGTMADRLGPRATVLGGLALASAAFCLYPFVREAWQAIALGAVLGTAAGGWLTGQSVLLAALVPSELRHVAFAQQRVAANLGLGLGGLAGGLIASTTDARSFTVLFVVNAATFSAYALFISCIRVPDTAKAPPRGYRVALRDPILRRVLAIDVAVVAAAVALLNGLLPVYARNDAGVAEKGIGALFLVNSLVIIGAQLPVARAVEGHSRGRMLALMAGCFSACWLLLLGRSFAFLLAGICVFSLGECLYDSVRSPLVADLAPPGLSGRYLASAGVSWQLGFVVGPAAGAALLGVSPYLLWPVAASVCAGAAVAALLLPPEAGITARRT